MMLEAVWFKNGKEIYKVSPVMNIVCYEDMVDISEIEVEDEERWHTSDDYKGDADNFIIRVKKN